MPNSVHVELPDNLTIAKVHSFHETLESIVDDKKNDEFIMDSGEVSRIDTAGVQLLYTFILAAQERDIKVTWNDPSDVLVTAASTLGLKDALGIH